MVDVKNASASIDTGVASPVGMFFSEDGNLVVFDATNFYRLTEHRDTYFADADRQQIVVREDYSSVEVTA